MKKRILSFVLVIALSLSLCGCTSVSIPKTPSKSSTFSILFIDVGQGVAALVECDGRYMLIDGGNTTAGDKVYEVLEEKGIQHLDILAIFHVHRDHIGGLAKALTDASRIDKTISNTDKGDTETFRELEHELGIHGATITASRVGEKYNLGSAEIEVIDVASENDNDSLVLLITYGKTKFLFTGDIEGAAQERISNKYQNDEDKPYEVDLIKMPHHGSYTGELYRFMRTFMPEYAIISAGKDNMYGHPHRETMDLLNNKELGTQVYRTDEDGDILVKSDGKQISVEKSK